MNFEKIRKEVDEVGFSIVENVISPVEIAVYKAALQKSLIDDKDEYGHFPGKKDNLIVDMVNRNPIFAKYLEKDNLYKIFSGFLNKDYTLYSFTSSVLHPGDRPEAANIHIDSNKFKHIPGFYFGLLMTLSLDDFTEENGATYYLPRSMHTLEKPSEDEFYSKAIRVTRKAGDAVVFNPLVWHSAGTNNTDKTRFAMTVYCCRSFMKQRLDFPRMVKPEILNILSERGRSILGLNTRVPSSLNEYYLPAEERQYKHLLSKQENQNVLF